MSAASTMKRNNNFNLLRILASLAVVLGHSFALLNFAEPTDKSLSMHFSAIAVDIFFLVSGFLVCGSLLRTQNLFDYVVARILRIYPALIVMLLLTVFVLGPVLTTLSFEGYVHHSQIYFYLKSCLMILGGIAYYLPGVFESNPYRGAVNGSLWTLYYELYMYIFLVAFWLLCQCFRQYRLVLFRTVIVLNSVVACILVLYSHFYIALEHHDFRLYYLFFSGACFYILRERIHFSAAIFVGILVVLMIAAVIHHDVFFVTYQLSIAYIVFYLAFVPSGWIRQYNRLGDYSYGIYIYAFPIQQTIIAMLPTVSVATLFISSLIATFVLSVVSWHVIERRALLLRHRFGFNIASTN